MKVVKLYTCFVVKSIVTGFLMDLVYGSFSHLILSIAELKTGDCLKKHSSKTWAYTWKWKYFKIALVGWKPRIKKCLFYSCFWKLALNSPEIFISSSSSPRQNAAFCDYTFHLHFKFVKTLRFEGLFPS